MTRGGSAIAFCAEMTQRADAPCVVMLSAASTPERVVTAIRAGANGGGPEGRGDRSSSSVIGSRDPAVKAMLDHPNLT